jgi:hypothetical protein
VELVPFDPSVTFRGSQSFANNYLGDLRANAVLFVVVIVVTLVCGAASVGIAIADHDEYVTAGVFGSFAFVGLLTLGGHVTAHLRFARKPLIVTLSHQGIDVQDGDRPVRHAWSWLTNIYEASGRVVVTFDRGRRRRTLVADEKTMSDAVAKLYALCVEHASPVVAEFARSRSARRSARTTASPPKRPSPDRTLN